MPAMAFPYIDRYILIHLDNLCNFSSLSHFSPMIFLPFSCQSRFWNAGTCCDYSRSNVDDEKYLTGYGKPSLPLCWIWPTLLPSVIPSRHRSFLPLCFALIPASILNSSFACSLSIPLPSLPLSLLLSLTSSATTS